MEYTSTMNEADIEAVENIADDTIILLKDIYGTKESVINGIEKNTKATSAFNVLIAKLIDHRDNVICTRIDSISEIK